MSRLPLPENPVPDHDLAKDVVEQHVIETVESRIEREEPIVTRKVCTTLHSRLRIR